MKAPKNTADFVEYLLIVCGAVSGLSIAATALSLTALFAASPFVPDQTEEWLWNAVKRSGSTMMLSLGCLGLGAIAISKLPPGEDGSFDSREQMMAPMPKNCQKCKYLNRDLGTRTYLHCAVSPMAIKDCRQFEPSDRP